MIDINEFRRNQSRFPRQELESYNGRYVAWSPDGTRILAADVDPAQVDALLRAAGYAPAEILVGRGQIRCRYAAVKLRISDGVSETYEWDAIVGFAPFPLLRNLLGFGGFLQFFDVSFRGAAEEAVLFPNALFSGRII